MTKQHGAMLAKGRLIGLQFDALFTDDLYFRISRHAIEMAYRLKDGLAAKGCRFFLDSPTNQQFHHPGQRNPPAPARESCRHRLGAL